MDGNSMVNMSSMANSLASSLANSNSMVAGFSNMSVASAFGNPNMGTSNMASGFGSQKYAVDQMSWNSQKYMGDVSWNTQFGLGRKPASELSPGSRKTMTGPLSSSQQQQQLPTQGQQAFNIQLPKQRKSGGFFGEEEDNETSMFFPGSSNIFRPEKDMMSQSQSPSNPYSFGSNFNTSQGINIQDRKCLYYIGNIMKDKYILYYRGVISAIGQHRAPISALQKRPIGSGLPSSSAAPISNLASSFGFSRADMNQPNFDLSDFPSLGNKINASNSMSSARNYAGFSHVAVGMVKNPVQDQTPEFQIQQEDFPALPGAQSTLSMFVSDPQNAGNTDPSKKQPTNLITGSSYEQALNKDSKFPGDKASSSAQRKGIQVHNDGRVTNIPQGMVPDQFGIVGLLTFIKSAETDPSLVALAPGMDLTTLGLNLNSPDNLYSTFQSPWVDLPCRPQDIDFHVPAEYLTNIYVRDKLAPIKLNRYGEDLLFFLFYMNGSDVLQLAAAAELYNRDWRYHKEERVWITRAPGVEPLVKTNAYERGTYYFFDAQNWRKVAKEFHLEYDKLEERPSLPPTLHHNPNQPIAAH
ncbi:CCR4-NOT transcription complex subunit 2-like [Ruditapes philippinarum]|uniref:CCR4-NOT transcription complex subunit 2-like n=1 Tax=Ruditapes philippinarum TaxID=129788 RepID=UPI00295B13CA|nr:CCR4-NOT transcription complex subunit 2-like [Ruditapes philippinarum]